MPKEAMQIKLVGPGGEVIKEPFLMDAKPAPGEVFRVDGKGEFVVRDAPPSHDVGDDAGGKTTSVTSIPVDKLPLRRDGARTAHGKRELKE